MPESIRVLKHLHLIRLPLIVQLVVLAYAASAQHGVITVRDSKNSEAVPFAHVCLEETKTNKKHYLVTDKEGRALNPCRNSSSIVVSFVGYKAFHGSIVPGEDKEVRLDPQIFDIDHVVITASVAPQKADQSIYNVKVIDQRQFELKAANNLTDILKDEMSFQVSHDPSLGSALRLKGLSGNNVKVLVDGVPVIGRMGGNIDISQLSLYNIDHLEVVEGPMSVIYGSNALAGAINIITKENQFSSLSSSTNAYYESAGRYNVDGSFSIKKRKNIYSFSGGRSFFGGVYFETDTNRSQAWKPKEQYNADFYFVRKSAGYKFKFQTSVMRETLLSKGDQQPPAYKFAQDSWFYSTRLTNRAEFNQRLGTSYFINMVGSHSYYDRRKLSYLKDFIESTTTLVDRLSAEHDTSTYSVTTYRLVSGNQNPESRLTFLAGLDLNHEVAKGKRIVNEQQEMSDWAVFSSAMYGISDNLSIQPGIRLAYNSRFEVPPVPSVNLKWKPISLLSIRASYARGYRAPTLKELYILFKDINHDIQPNQDLKPEWGHNFDLSFSLITEKAPKIHFSSVEVSLFYNQMSNIIYLAPVSQGGAGGFYKYANISHYNSVGGKLIFKYSFYPHFDFGLGLGNTGVSASFDESLPTLDAFRFTPEGSVNSSFTFQRVGVRVNASYKFTGKTYLFSLADNATITQGYISSYHNLDFSLHKKFLANKFTATMGVKNLFGNTLIAQTGNVSGTAHTSPGGSPIGYGRVFFTSISYNFYR